ncbi:Alpha/Beta hydrolase protein [Cristinia sonorae]|uniref:Alpha/Beta hydrolase protein n=1 Tax=Cristinia sonorae TaxID=1940300 RepID=A0A8K0XUD8_9AGAR|nr:Alpha/Beta hydrolase protein [Cristinia sonorae]
MSSGAEEQYLNLPDGRTLAYAHGGNFTSSEVIIFFHGVFGVGGVSRLPPAFAERDVHYIAPTLPGWGKTSPTPSSRSFHETLYKDTAALISHLYPQTNQLRLYISGGSFGTVAAQILYGASYEAFPLGRQISGLLLIAPISPPHVHEGFTRCLSWMNYFALGPPAKILPFNLTQRMGIAMFRKKLDTPEHAAGFIREYAFKNLTPEEREGCEAWKTLRGFEEGQAEKEIGMSTFRSVEVTWEGFLAVPSVIHSDWGGYDPRIEDESRKAPVLVVMNREDKDHKLMGEWLVSSIKGATALYKPGGHMASLFYLDDIWAQFLRPASAAL